MKTMNILILIVVLGAMFAMIVFPVEAGGVFPAWLNEDYILIALGVAGIIALLTLF